MKLTAQQKLERCIQISAELEFLLASMRFEYADHRGCLAESVEYAEYIFANLVGHKNDIERGRE